MEPTTLGAILSFVGSAFGTLAGILINSKLTNYRIEQLEKKVDAYNNVKDRTTELEAWKESVNLEFKDIKSRLDKLEAFHMKG